MVSEIYMICNAYESGFGHGMQKDGHNNFKLDLYGGTNSKALNDAYVIGYKEGEERADSKPSSIGPIIKDAFKAGFTARGVYAQTNLGSFAMKEEADKLAAKYLSSVTAVPIKKPEIGG